MKDILEVQNSSYFDPSRQQAKDHLQCKRYKVKKFFKDQPEAHIRHAMGAHQSKLWKHLALQKFFCMLPAGVEMKLDF